MFGGWLVAATLGWLVVGEDRDFRLFGPFPVALSLFGGLFLAFGVGLGLLVDRVDPGRSTRPSSTIRRVASWAGLASTALLGAIVLVQEVVERI